MSNFVRSNITKTYQHIINIMRLSSAFITALLPLILLLASAPVVSADDKDYDENPYFLLMGEADKAIADGKYEDAADRINEAMSIDPKNPGNLILRSNLAMVYSYLDRDSTAIATLDSLIAEAPSMSVAIANRGRLYLKTSQNRRAYDDFERVISLDSLNRDARYFHGMMALYGGHQDTAEADFAVLSSVDADSYQTAVALSTLYSLTGRDREAVPYFEKLIKLEPTPEFYAGLAGCLLSLGELSRASETIDAGLKRHSHDPELYYYRAWLNRDRFRLDEAHSDARRAIELGASADRVNALFEKH